MVARHDKLRQRISSAIKEILIQLGENLAEVRLRGDFNKVEQWEGHLIREERQNGERCAKEFTLNVNLHRFCVKILVGAFIQKDSQKG